MFYDLEDPVSFATEVASILDGDGIWVFEQSYLPTMLATNSFDTVCHEHLEYYARRQIMWIADRAGLKIVDIELNKVNGGSFSVVAAHKNASERQPTDEVKRALSEESNLGLERLETYEAFGNRSDVACRELLDFLHQAKREGKTVYGLGAPTKGNVLLQYAGITTDLVLGIADVNPDKFGCVTPGTDVPILQEVDVFTRRPNYLLVLPWHFRRFFLSSPHLKRSTSGECPDGVCQLQRSDQAL